LPIKILNQEEIHNIAHKAIEQGVSRVLIASSVASEENRQDLITLFSILRELKHEDNSSYWSLNLYEKSDINLYNEYMDELTQYAGKEWVKEFAKNTSMITKERLPNPKRLIWDAAFHPQKFNKNLKLNQNSSIENNSSESLTETYEKKTTLSNITNVIEKFRKTGSELIKSIKPH
jgi:hypothetical protein